MVAGFCSIGGWCYSGWWVWAFRTLTQFQGNEMSPGLFQNFMNGYITFFDSLSLLVELRVPIGELDSAGSQSMVITVGFQ